MLIAMPNEDETFLQQSALKHVNPDVWVKERYR